MTVPTITIFVRHAASCRYKDDESWKRCNCRKHLRWFHNGVQRKASAKTRSWQEAENKKREMEDKFRTGGTPTAITDARKTIADVIELYLTDLRTSALDASIVKKHERETGRFRSFCESRSKFFPAEVDKELLIHYRATWDELYPSTWTRSLVQSRLRRFLRFCQDYGLAKIPKLSSIKPDEPPTMPLSKEQYAELLAEIPKILPDRAARVRALLQLMRHSGLAIRDAVTIQRSEILHDAKKQITRIVTARQKTGKHVSVPLPPDVAAEVIAVLNGNPRYVFWSGNGLEQSAVTNWQHDLRAVFRFAFGKDTQFTPHCLRDTFACELLSAGVPMEEVSKALGHSSIKITEKHYSAWVKSRQERLDSLIMETWKAAANV
jgi:integrase/recombinase XerD